jgi:hypothetical protein
MEAMGIPAAERRRMIEETGRAARREMAGFIVTAVLNVQDDPDAAMTNAKNDLDLYSGADHTPERLWAACSG